MNNSIKASFEFDSKTAKSIEFPDEQTAATLELAPIGPRLFRIESVPFMVEAACFGDVIEADSTTNGNLIFVRIAERGGWRTYDFLIPAELIESEHITAIQDRVSALGGHWERVFGGVLFLCLPPTSDYDPTEDMQSKS
jgi:Domain of unknown function (DUF4265)